MNCDILKSKLIICEWNAFYFIEIALIGFTLHEIKQCVVFFGTPGIRKDCTIAITRHDLFHAILQSTLDNTLSKTVHI